MMPTRRRETLLTPLLRVLKADRKAAAGAMILLAFVLLGAVGPFFVGDPTALVGVPLQPPSWVHLLGTNGQGQDVLAQLVVGTRVSLELARVKQAAGAASKGDVDKAEAAAGKAREAFCRFMVDAVVAE